MLWQQKCEIVRKHVSRLLERKDISFEDFQKDQNTQDIVLLNLQMAIQTCIGLASHIVSDNAWPVPGSMRDVFDILFDKKVLTSKTREVMIRMTGMRNLIAHEYARIDLQKIHDVLSGRLNDALLQFKRPVGNASLTLLAGRVPY